MVDYPQVVWSVRPRACYLAQGLVVWPRQLPMGVLRVFTCQVDAPAHAMHRALDRTAGTAVEQVVFPCGLLTNMPPDLGTAEARGVPVVNASAISRQACSPDALFSPIFRCGARVLGPI